MRAGFHRAFAVVLNFAAPEKYLSVFVGGLQFQPGVERVHRPAGEEVPDLARTHNDVHANVIAPANRRIRAIDGRGDRADFAGRSFRQ